MAQYAAQYETSATFTEAWQRISSTRLRKKIVKEWTRVYVGIPSKADAEALLEEVLQYSNVDEGTMSLVEGGLWKINISFKTASWVDPAQYITG